MTEPLREIITHAGAWRGPEIKDDDSWIIRLDGAAIDEIDAALTGVKDKGLTIPFGRSDFPLPTFSSRLDEIPDRLEMDRTCFRGRILKMILHPPGLVCNSSITGMPTPSGLILTELQERGP